MADPLTDGWRESHGDDDMVIFLLMRQGLSGLKAERFPRHACAGQSPSTPIEESCAHTRIDPEEGNITHGLNATPRALTLVGIAVHRPTGSVEREAVVRISV